MHLRIWDTVTLLEPLFVSTDRPSQLLEAVRPLFYAEGGLGSANSRMQSDGSRAVLDVVQLDGFDAAMAQQAWGLMNPTRSRSVSAWEFETFREADVLGQVEQWLTRWFTELPPGQQPKSFEVVVVPADSANRNLMVRCHGLSVGGFAGGITATVWPSEHNLARLEASFARAFVTAVRRHLAPPQTLADHLALEGLAAAFVAEFSESPSSWLVPFRAPEGWPQELTRVASLYSLASYEELVTNVYGTRLSGETECVLAEPLADDEREYARELVLGALDETDPRAIAAFLYGDAAVVAQGHAGVGMPSFGGFEIAYRAVSTFLDTSEGGALAALGLDSRALLASLASS